ncbi:MAG: hypothetical protein MJE77_20110 [Proteobacteria bacterium]|nr:hypothetical protein [Pseudomonadota bacterium]
MKRKLLIALFSAGAIVGFASGIAHVSGHHKHHRAEKYRAIVDMCVDAALRARSEQATGRDRLAHPDSEDIARATTPASDPTGGASNTSNQVP